MGKIKDRFMRLQIGGIAGLRSTRTQIINLYSYKLQLFLRRLDLRVDIVI